jgi:hypothetical protein
MMYDAAFLKVHTAPDGLVWYVNGISPAECSNQSAEEFLASHIASSISLNVRLIGIKQNADLISALYLRKKHRKLGSVYLAGPNVCESPLELEDPGLTFRRMRESFAAPSCGGWREMTDADAAVYGLITRIQQEPDWFDIRGRLYYETHPVFKIAKFIKTISHRDVAQLIATIIDPRWYVDRRRPDTGAKLKLFMGLTPKTQRRVSAADKVICRGRDLRCAMVLNCWKTVDPATVDFEHPQNFLWRIWKNAGADAKGDLRASQAFIGYLQTNWAQALVAARGAPSELFLPDKFFKTDAEKQAYSDKMA